MYKFGKITIICVGNLKEDYLRQAQGEFVKRLTPYGKLNIIEVAQDDNPAKEAGRILQKLSPNSYKIAMAIGGKSPSSEEFAKDMSKLAVSGHSHLEFIIGGSVGLADEVLNICNLRLSLSNMTFTHQMARIILLEQVYRTCRILNNEPYHK
ncbi:MAG: 23S rRNA (pseudouridine(1915)-N(3))-methyltransferase RlmH [Defluviitaleaceae bacterium]|nr:23S rRNA (pseudouridine(1915)-N(3))-methyltransferase RlmH [Defluviitaleaceae bacterium]